MSARGTNARPRRAAFSLIEVTIAIAIFAMACTVLMGSFVNALLAREHATRRDVQAADIRIVRMQLLLEPNLEDAEEGGEVDTFSSGEARWEAEIEPTNIVDLFQVDLRVEFPDFDPTNGGTDTYTERLYLLRPTWSEGDERSDLLEDKKEDLLDRRDFGF